MGSYRNRSVELKGQPTCGYGHKTVSPVNGTPTTITEPLSGS